jgi:4-amino-4-deoxy-L-arabinose transferase-like glycosyltransferase
VGILTRVRIAFRRLPRVVVAVFAIALLNGLAWSLLTPPFQVPDEPEHFAYVQHLALTGERAGKPDRPEFSSEQAQAMSAMRSFSIIGRSLVHPPATHSASDTANSLIKIAEDKAPRDDGGGLSVATSGLPLYYAVETVPYRLFSWASLPARLEAMRVLSVLMFAISAALCALIAAELLPRRPWVPVVGGLAIGLSPYTASVASGVTPDVMLLLVSAAVILAVVRAFRRGLTMRRGITLGLLVGAGLLTKLAFFGFAPAAGLALLILIWRDRHALMRTDGRWGLLRVAVSSGGAALALPVAYVVYVAVSGGKLLPAGGGGAPGLPAAQVDAFNLHEFLSYTWQLYLPRLPSQIDQFGFSAPYETWIKGFAGRFGWLDYQVPEWVVGIARDVVFAGLALIAIALVRGRRAVWRHRLEIGVLAVFAAVIAYEIAKKGYDYHRQTGLIFEQARYLFPLAGLYAGAAVLALTAFGRRAAPVLAVLAVALFAVHDVVGVMSTLARYYG